MSPIAVRSAARRPVTSLVPRWRDRLQRAGETGRQPAAGRGQLILLMLLGLTLATTSILLALPQQVAADPARFFVISGVQYLCYGLATILALRRRLPLAPTLAFIVLVALAARLAFVPQMPTASTDIYRYVWDGRVQVNGINPYLYPPDDPALADLHDEPIFSNVNRPAVRTIYPPVAEAIYLGIYLVHPDSHAWTRIAFTLIDLASIGLLMLLLPRLGFRPDRAILYAWHPLVILELGHSGHVDVVVIPFILLAIHARLSGRIVPTGVLLAAATLVKYYAIVALPALLFKELRRDLRLGLTIVAATAAAYLPYLGAGTHVVGYLPGYLHEEGIASGDRFYLLGQFRRFVDLAELLDPLSPARAYQLALVAVMGVVAILSWRGADRAEWIPDRVLVLFVALYVLSSPTYPWYALTIVALLPLVRGRVALPAVAIGLTAVLLYLQWWWSRPLDWPRDVVFGGSTLVVLLVVAGWAWERLRERTRTARFSDQAQVWEGG